MGNDYYKTLGVTPNAEDVVIRAAHKALTQHYNLDGWKGDKLEANRMLFELNEALVVLTDSEKRKLFDDSRANESQPSESSLAKVEFSVDQISKDWQVACQFNPELIEISNELTSLSGELSLAFKIALLESRRFDDCYRLAKKIEQEYLQKLFGKNEDVQRFGHDLLKEGLSDAAIELNDIVRVMGDSIDAPSVIDSISKKHQPQKWIESEKKQKLIILETQAALEKSQEQFAERERKIVALKELKNHKEAEATQTLVVIVICLFALFAVAGFFFSN